MEITNIHLLSTLDEIKVELIEKGFIIKRIRLTDDEQMFAHLIAVYEATKNLID